MTLLKNSLVVEFKGNKTKIKEAVPRLNVSGGWESLRASVKKRSGSGSKTKTNKGAETRSYPTYKRKERDTLNTSQKNVKNDSYYRLLRRVNRDVSLRRTFKG